MARGNAYLRARLYSSAPTLATRASAATPAMASISGACVALSQGAWPGHPQVWANASVTQNSPRVIDVAIVPSFAFIGPSPLNDTQKIPCISLDCSQRAVFLERYLTPKEVTPRLTQLSKPKR